MDYEKVDIKQTSNNIFMPAFVQCDMIIDIHLEMYRFIIYGFDAVAAVQ